MRSANNGHSGGLWAIPTARMGRLEELMHRLCVNGRLDPAGTLASHHLRSGGKRVRARLALVAAELLGFHEDVIAWAAACELLHNASLIHDDIQDGDRMRRDRPSIWATHGTSWAISVGDLMLMLPWVALNHLSCDEATRWRLARALASRAQATARAQAVEIEINSRYLTDWFLWRDTAEGKTGELLALPVEGAALLAGHTEKKCREISNAFRGLGLAYQLWNDLEDFQAHVTGDTGSDLRSGRLNGVVLGHLRLWPDDRDLVVSLLRSHRDADIAALVARLIECGVVEGVIAQIAELTARVLASQALVALPALQSLALELAGDLGRLHGSSSSGEPRVMCYGLP
jgi:geranylgeranyl diphosphate synthase, type I